MRTRVVMVTLEIETDARLAELRDKANWQEAVDYLDKEYFYNQEGSTVHQVQVNVIKPVKDDRNGK